jgi:hypothetical protein
MKRSAYLQPTEDVVRQLSAPEGSWLWADGIRREIHMHHKCVDTQREYVSHCLRLLLSSGGWRLLRNADGDFFGSFIKFCRAARSHGLGLTRAELESLLVD